MWQPALGSVPAGINSAKIRNDGDRHLVERLPVADLGSASNRQIARYDVEALLRGRGMVWSLDRKGPEIPLGQQGVAPPGCEAQAANAEDRRPGTANIITEPRNGFDSCEIHHVATNFIERGSGIILQQRLATSRPAFRAKDSISRMKPSKQTKANSRKETALNMEINGKRRKSNAHRTSSGTGEGNDRNNVEWSEETEGDQRSEAKESVRKVAVEVKERERLTGFDGGEVKASPQMTKEQPMSPPS